MFSKKIVSLLNGIFKVQFNNIPIKCAYKTFNDLKTTCSTCNSTILLNNEQVEQVELSNIWVDYV